MPHGHPLVREALTLVGIDGGIEIASMADIPSKGSGLGSSSTYTVGLLNALYAYRNQFASKEKLARQACEIEIDRCGEPIGKQDQYAAAYGGLNLIRFHPDDSVSVDPVICKPSLLREMEDSTLVFFTGRTRSASAVLANQSAAMKTSDRRALMRRMVELAFEMKEQLESGTLDHLGDLLDENWRLKAQLTAGTGKKFRGVCLCDNVGLITAYGNDLSYADVFAGQVDAMMDEGDLLVAVSGSGNSPNVLKAIEAARRAGGNVLGVVGYDGGKMKPMCDHSVWVNSFDMQLCEDVHLMFGHMVMKTLCGSIIK